MTLSAADLSALRSQHPHVSKLNMSVLKPTVVYCGTVSGSPAYGARAITVVNVSGDISDIEAGMTMFVGTSCGDKSISKRRIRSVAGQVLNLDENTVTWAAGQYITVMQNWELWSIFPYINPTTYEFFKDYDIAYSDQNLYPNPVAIAGPHRAKFLDGYSVSFDLDASDSYAIASGATIASYLWECVGGSIANATAASTTLSFTSPGQYWLKLTVTDSNGKSQVTRRAIFVHQRTGAYAPYYDWSFETAPSGDWTTGGWTASIKVTGSASQADFPDGTLVVIWYETYFNGTERYINGDNLVLVGYIASENIQKTMDIGQVVFQVETINGLLDKTAMRSVTLVYEAAPDTWYEMANLTMRRAVHHLWKWHSTLLDVCDVYMTEDNDLIYAVDDFTNGTLYKQVDNFTYQHGNFSHVCCNKKGVLYLEKDINTLTTSERAAIGIDWLLTDEDRRGPTDLEMLREPYNRTSYVIVSGTSYDGSTTTPLIAQAPGEIPHNFGQSEVTFERLVLDNQAQANHYAGRVMAIANREIAEIRIPLAGNYLGAIDIVPQQWLYLSLSASDNKRGFALDTRLIPRSVKSDINMQAGTILVDIITEPEAIGPDGIAADIPTVEPSDDPIDYEPPPIPEIPPWPPLPIPAGCSTNDAAPANGPYSYPMSVTIQGTDLTPYVVAPLSCYIRRSTAAFKTIMLVDGCHYFSTDGGATWAPELSANPMVLSAYKFATGPGAPTAINFPVVDTGCGIRGGEFSPASAYATQGFAAKVINTGLMTGISTFERIALTPKYGPDAIATAYGEWGYHHGPEGWWAGACYKVTFTSDMPYGVLYAYVRIVDSTETGSIGVGFMGRTPIGQYPFPVEYMPFLTADGGGVAGSGVVGETVLLESGTVEAPTAGSTWYFSIRNIAPTANGPPTTLWHESTFDVVSAGWKHAGTSDLFFVGKLNKIEITNIRIYNVCFD